MNRDIIEVRDSAVIASEINYIKRRTCEQVLSASVEIGRLLCEAKDTVPVGEWMDWLADNVAYSQSTANNLMALYREYGEQAQIGFFEDNRLEIFGDLSPSQAVALLPLPYAERKAYVETHDMSETSVRDIQEEIKARKKAEEALEKARDELDGAKVDIEALENDVAALKEELEAAKAAAPAQVDIDGEREKIRSEVEAEYKKKIDAAEKKLKKAKEDAEKAEAAKDAAERGAEARAEAAKAEAVKEAEEKVAGELTALREKAAALEKTAATAADAAVQKFGVHFDLWQREGVTLIDILGEIGDEDVRSKCAAGIKAMCESVAKNAGCAV